MTNNRITNHNFFDEYEFFDALLAESFKVENDGIQTYINKMKEGNIEASERIPEWNNTIARLEHLKKRYEALKNAESSFDDYQGKDEDVVWIRIFITKLNSKADPLSKYSQLVFYYKKRKKSWLQILSDFFNGKRS